MTRPSGGNRKHSSSAASADPTDREGVPRGLAKYLRTGRQQALAITGTAVTTAVVGWATGGLQWVGDRVVDAVRGERDPVTVTGRGVTPTPGHPTGGAASAPGRAASPRQQALSAGAAEGVCSHFVVGRVVRKPAAEIRPPRDPSSGADIYENVRDWIEDYQAADANLTGYQFVVQARPGKTVELLDARVRYLQRKPPAEKATVVKLNYTQCGGVEEIRSFTVDLDDPTGTLHPAADEKTRFPYTVTHAARRCWTTTTRAGRSTPRRPPACQPSRGALTAAGGSDSPADPGLRR